MARRGASAVTSHGTSTLSHQSPRTGRALSNLGYWCREAHHRDVHAAQGLPWVRRRGAPVTVMPRVAVADVLACLEDEFETFADAFCRGEYLLWLGSGISRDVVPGVPVLLQHLLEFLRGRIDAGNPNCRFRAALEEVLDVGGVPDDVRAGLDYAVPVSAWGAADDLVGRLVDRYSEVLNVQVRGEPEDFLVWAGLGVATTYGDPALRPDAEHYCVAILMLEGVVSSAPTTNWDGLVEAAMGDLADDADGVLRVIVTPEDFRAPRLRTELVKFHGCAVRAAANEATYRSRLIARSVQISGWTTKPENRLMKNRLEELFATRPALVVGLSAQDSNVQSVFHQAIQNLPREWPESPPPVVFAEQALHRHHRLVLQVAFGESYAANADEIASSALLGAYAKPTLVALVLHTLFDKLCVLLGCVTEFALPAGDLERLRRDLRRLRDRAAGIADADVAGFIQALVPLMSLVLSVFRTGRIPDPGDVHYQPISNAPVTEAIRDPDYPAAALGRLAVAASLLSRGSTDGIWGLEVGTLASPSHGAARVLGSHGALRVFVVKDSRALAELETGGVVDLGDDDVLVLQAESAQPAATRSPSGRYGRTGVGSAVCVDLEELCATVKSADALLEAFRVEGAL